MCNGNCSNNSGTFNGAIMGDGVNMGLGWSDLGDFADNVLDGLGSQFKTNAQNAQTNVNYNQSVVDAIAAKSKLQAENAKRMYNIAQTAVIGILVIVALVYAAKIFLKK
jgi:hypothetical protein